VVGCCYEHMKEKITITLDKEIIEASKAYKKTSRISVSGQAELALIEYLKKHYPEAQPLG